MNTTKLTIEEHLMFHVPVKVEKPTAEQLQDPAMPLHHRSFFTMLQHPALEVAANRADVLAATFSHCFHTMIEAMPVSVIDMARELDRLCTSRNDACAAALRKMHRICSKWDKTHTPKSRRHKTEEFALCDELSFDELVASIDFSKQEDFDNLVPN